MTSRSASTFRILVPVVAAVAGLLAAVAVASSRGAQLPGQRTDLPSLVASRQSAVARLQQQAAALRSQVDARTAGTAAGNEQVQKAQQAESQAGTLAGTAAVSGPGVMVSLDDAPRSARTRPPPPGIPPPTANDLVVHQQDVQAAFNGLRAGGAKALSVMGQRVIATTAVRCVGNTLLVNGRVYSPPFVIRAVGDPQHLRSGPRSRTRGRNLRQYVRHTGSGSP